jgi:transposase InsO family protein
MARKVIAMRTRLAAVLAADAGALNVSAVCAELAISRDTYYRYKRRFAAEGPPGLAERSRRPHHSPNQTPVEVEEAILRLRKELPLDNGAQTIAYHLGRAGLSTPSLATIHRILVRHGQVVAQPAKRPRSSWKRFEWPKPNDVWQMDATCWALIDGSQAWIMDALDDHSRAVVAAQVCAAPTTDAAFDALCVGARDWGLPARVLSDNGRCFTTRTMGGDSPGEFERMLRGLGIAQMLSSPGHPQTCGKIERFHQTLKRWLGARPLAGSPDELQRQLDEFLAFYNHQRPHRALGGRTPVEHWSAQPRSRPGNPLGYPPHAELYTVDSWGTLKIRGQWFGLGRPYAHRQVLAVVRDREVAVFDRHGLIRRITLVPGKPNYPLGPERRGIRGRR